MLLPRKSEYALQAVVWLACHGQRPRTAKGIARATGIPPGYLVKVLHELVNAGILRSRRGLHGGYTLTQPIDALTMLDVLRAVDYRPQLEACSLGLASDGSCNCPLHARLEAALDVAETVLDRTTIADLIADAPPHWPLTRPEGALR